MSCVYEPTPKDEEVLKVAANCEQAVWLYQTDVAMEVEVLCVFNNGETAVIRVVGTNSYISKVRVKDIDFRIRRENDLEVCTSH